MHAGTGVFSREAVKEHTKSSKKPESTWNTAPENKMQSNVGCVQIYSVKSQISFKSGGLAFCPFCVTLLNFSKRMSRLRFLFSATILGYLPDETHSSVSHTI